MLHIIYIGLCVACLLQATALQCALSTSCFRLHSVFTPLACSRLWTAMCSMHLLHRAHYNDLASVYMAHIMALHFA